jgi:hypothetical protein
MIEATTFQPPLIRNACGIPIPSTLVSSATERFISDDGNSKGKSGRMDDAGVDSLHIPKKSKLALLSSGISTEKDEENNLLMSSGCETHEAESNIQIGRFTVEDRVRARALLQQSTGPSSSMSTSDIHSTLGVRVANPDIVLRIADGIWSHAATRRKQRVLNEPTKTISNPSAKLKDSIGLSNFRTFVLKDIIHLLRTTTMSYVGSTGKVMKSNGDVKRKLSKRQIVEAIMELATPDRYSNWIVLISSDSLVQSVLPSSVHVDGIVHKEGKGPLLLQNMSPNTLIQMNHSVPYTAVRKQILKTLV